MKHCPHCHICVGGDTDYCPLCQNSLSGTGETAHFPPTAPQMHRVSMFFKVITFLALSGAIVSFAVDFMLQDAPHRHWSVLVIAYALPVLFFLRRLLAKRRNGPLLAFQLLVIAILLSIFTDFFLGFTGLSIDLVVPVLCGGTLLVNFAFAFFNSHFTANALIYLLLNMVVGVVPYLILFVRGSELLEAHSVPWVICLLISAVTFLGLVVFKGPTLKVEIEKRLHL